MPAGLSGVSAIAARRNHTVALKTDGTVVAWGDNGNGQTTVPAGLSGGERHRSGWVSHGGAEDGRHGGGLGLQRLWPDDGASGLERGERHHGGWVSHGGAEDGRHGGGLGRQRQWPDDGASGLERGERYRGGCVSSHGGPGVFAPTVAFVSLTDPTTSGATVNGSINPNWQVTTALVEYGTSTSYGNTATIPLSPNDGSGTQGFSLPLGGLVPGTLYHYRITATNVVGTTVTADQTFTTLGYPKSPFTPAWMTPQLKSPTVRRRKLTLAAPESAERVRHGRSRSRTPGNCHCCWTAPLLRLQDGWQWITTAPH